MPTNDDMPLESTQPAAGMPSAMPPATDGVGPADATGNALPVADAAPPDTSRQGPRRAVFRTADKRGVGIGAHVTATGAYFVKIKAQRGQIPEILDTAIVRLSDTSDEAAMALLQAELKRLGGHAAATELWTCMQSPQTVIQTIRVPHVGAATLANVAFWTLKKERNLSVDDTIFDIEHLRDVHDEGRPMIELQAVAVPKTELEQATRMFATMGLPPAGVTAPVFAFRNLLRYGWTEALRRQCVLLFVDEASTDVLIFTDGQLLATRTVRSGLASIREAICQALDIDARDPRLQQAMRLLRGEAAEAVGSPAGTPPFDVETVLSWIRPAARRLVRNVQRTLHAFEGQLRSEGEVPFLLAGTMVCYPPVVQFLSQQLGVRLQTATPAGSAALEKTMLAAAADSEEGSGLALAFGLALSGVYNTANLLFTFSDRRRQQQRQMRVRALRLTCFTVLAALVCAVGFVHFSVLITDRQVRTMHEMAGTQLTPVSREDVEIMLDKVKTRQDAIRRLAQAYVAPAIIAEVSGLTPRTIRLLALHLELAPPAAPGSAAGRGTAGVGRTAAARRVQAMAESQGADDAAETIQRLSLDGVIAGVPGQVESLLADYVVELSRSPLLGNPRVVQQTLEMVEPGVLLFGPPDSTAMLSFQIVVYVRKR